MKEELLSLPSRECGLKYDGEKVADDAHVVTPFAGVWIEIGLRIGNRTNGESHSLRGSVD